MVQKSDPHKFKGAIFRRQVLITELSSKFNQTYNKINAASRHAKIFLNKNLPGVGRSADAEPTRLNRLEADAGVEGTGGGLATAVASQHDVVLLRVRRAQRLRSPQRHFGVVRGGGADFVRVRRPTGRHA